MTTQAETSQQTPAVSEARAIAPAGREPAAETAAVPPSPGEAGDKQPEAATTRKPEPPLVKCTLERASWPADGTEQAKAIQILLRDLGFYSGTTYGTLGPTTRAAIRKFQVAEGEADTGEPSEMLFQSLRKKCAP